MSVPTLPAFSHLGAPRTDHRLAHPPAGRSRGTRSCSSTRSGASPCPCLPDFRRCLADVFRLPPTRRVWKAEKTKADEDKKLKQLMKERAEERQLAELQALQEAQTGKKKTDKLDWMYATPASGGGIKGEELEDYLLGKRRVDTILKGDDEKLVRPGRPPRLPILAPERSVWLTICPLCSPPPQVKEQNLQAVQNANTARDTAAKIREDPLFAIKQQEQAAYQALMSNPLRLKQLRDKELGKEGRKEDKKRDKEERRREKEERRARKAGGGGGGARDRSRSPPPARRIDGEREREREHRERDGERDREHRDRDRDRDGHRHHRHGSSSRRSRSPRDDYGRRSANVKREHRSPPPSSLSAPPPPPSASRSYRDDYGSERAGPSSSRGGGYDDRRPGPSSSGGGGSGYARDGPPHQARDAPPHHYRDAPPPAHASSSSSSFARIPPPPPQQHGPAYRDRPSASSLNDGRPAAPAPSGMNADRAARLAAMSSNAESMGASSLSSLSAHPLALQPVADALLFDPARSLRTDTDRTSRLELQREHDRRALEAEAAHRAQLAKTGIKADVVKGMQREAIFGAGASLEGRLRDAGRRGGAGGME